MQHLEAVMLEHRTALMAEGAAWSDDELAAASQLI
jgi:hypothetical protein